MIKEKTVKIEKGIPFPVSKMRLNVFPLAKMKVGDSFANDMSFQQALYQTISHYHKRIADGKRFTTRKRLENGKFVMRCWRIT